MKNINYIINGILTVAIIVLFILQFTGKKSDSKQSETVEVFPDSTILRLPVAYIKSDSLLFHYKYFNDLNDKMMKNMEEKKLVVERRAERLRKEVVDFQERSQKGLFYSEEKQKQEYERLAKQEHDLNNFTAGIQDELSKEQIKMNSQLQDTIVYALKLFNTPKKYVIIFSNAGMDNILYADDIYDITYEFTEFLNDRYVPVKK